jgi:hypothetical protein
MLELFEHPVFDISFRVPLIITSNGFLKITSSLSKYLASHSFLIIDKSSNINANLTFVFLTDSVFWLLNFHFFAVSSQFFLARDAR